MEQEQCRMCAKMADLSDLLEISTDLQNMIKFHCRLELNMLDRRYPSKICYDCSTTIENFSMFTEEAKTTQLKFSALYQDIKVEIEDLPTLIQDTRSSDMYIDEPKVEINEIVDDDNDEEIDEIKPFRRKIYKFEEVLRGSAEGSDYSSIESDSEYGSNKYFKRKRPVKHRRVRMKKKKNVRMGDEENEIFNDIPEIDRYKNGSIKKKSLALYEGKMWSDFKVGCVECDQSCDGPFELRQHHFKFHSLDTQYGCKECAGQNDVNFSYFYQYLNHYPEHQKHLKFCCVS